MSSEKKLGFSGALAKRFQNSKITPLLALTGLLLGLFAIAVTPREEEPQINVTFANIFVPFPGASAIEVENLVGLEEISENFALSDEFVNTYGTLNSADFVTLVYRNVLGREPDQGGFTYWKGLLDSGAISYGGTMLSFSESKEYVLRTATVRPAAGYLLWFDAGTKFYCGIGSADVVVPFPSGSLGYVMLPPASGRAWGHEFDVYLPGATAIFKDNRFDPSIPNTATVLTADFENLQNYVFRLSVEPDIRWSLNLATGGQPDNQDTWLGDQTVPKS